MTLRRALVALLTAPVAWVGYGAWLMWRAPDFNDCWEL